MLVDVSAVSLASSCCGVSNMTQVTGGPSRRSSRRPSRGPIGLSVTPGGSCCSVTSRLRLGAVTRRDQETVTLCCEIFVIFFKNELFFTCLRILVFPKHKVHTPRVCTPVPPLDWGRGCGTRSSYTWSPAPWSRRGP